MKRFFALFLALFICITTLSGCITKDDKNAADFIRAGSVTKEQQEILDLVNEAPPRLYDFEVHGAKSMKVELLTLEGGKWVCHSSSLAAVPDNSEIYSGQIALSLADSKDPFGGYSIAITDADGFTKCSHDPEPDSKKYPSHSYSSIVDEPVLKLNEPIAVGVLYGCKEVRDVSVSYDPHFALTSPGDIDSDIAKLLTVTFYDKPISEIDDKN